MLFPFDICARIRLLSGIRNGLVGAYSLRLIIYPLPREQIGRTHR